MSKDDALIARLRRQTTPAPAFRLPAGGLTGQFLSKTGPLDDQIGWRNPPASGGGGSSDPTFETVSKNLSAQDAILTYSGDTLTAITYANGITKTLTYTSGRLASITLSGATPGGIELTKTLTYTGPNLTGVTYS